MAEVGRVTAPILRFRGPSVRRRFVLAQLHEAERWLALGRTGDVPLEAAVTEAYLAITAANREVLRGDLDQERSA
jgi:hypothetical protein